MNAQCTISWPRGPELPSLVCFQKIPHPRLGEKASEVNICPINGLLHLITLGWGRKRTRTLPEPNVIMLMDNISLTHKIVYSLRARLYLRVAFLISVAFLQQFRNTSRQCLDLPAVLLNLCSQVKPIRFILMPSAQHFWSSFLL